MTTNSPFTDQSLKWILHAGHYNVRSMKNLTLITFCLLLSFGLIAEEQAISPDLNPDLQSLAADFFSWRASQQPASGDDIPRVERPDDWLPDWSPQALILYRAAHRDFMARLDVMNRNGFTVSDQVDERLLRAAIQRVHWELDLLRHPYRNPLFYIDQTIGSVFELLVLSSPWSSERTEQLIQPTSAHSGHPGACPQQPHRACATIRRCNHQHD